MENLTEQFTRCISKDLEGIHISSSVLKKSDKESALYVGDSIYWTGLLSYRIQVDILISKNQALHIILSLAMYNSVMIYSNAVLITLNKLSTRG